MQFWIMARLRSFLFFSYNLRETSSFTQRKEEHSIQLIYIK